MRHIALITGATSGIGQATARLLSKNGFDIIAIGRRRDRLEELQKSCETKVLPVALDVRCWKDVNTDINNLDEDWSGIDVLVNNAGIAQGHDSVQNGDPNDWDCMIDTNIKGVLYVTRAVAPGMVKRKRGHIVNIGSIAGKEVYKGGAVYNATKFAVDALTKGMRIDLLEHDIRVTSICPGRTETEFSIVRFKGDARRAQSVYEGYQPLRAEDIAEAVWFAISRPAHVNINDMLVMPTAQANSVQIHKKS